MGPKDRNRQPIKDPVAFVNTVMAHVAEEEADQATGTADDRRWARELRQQVDIKLAALRRELAATPCKHKRPPPIPEEIRALERPELLEHLVRLRGCEGVRYAHLDLQGLTDDDLRQLIAAILEPAMDDEPAP